MFYPPRTLTVVALVAATAFGASATWAQTPAVAASAAPPAPATGPGPLAHITAVTEHRLVPEPLTRTLINLGTKHLDAVFGGIGEGSTVAGGVRFTTADSLRYVVLSVTALGSVQKDRRFEVEAYVPSLFDERTHADVLFVYQRRPKLNFFGLGPDVGDTEAVGADGASVVIPSLTDEAYRTSYDLERRGVTATVSRDLGPGLRVGAFFDLTSSSMYRGTNNSYPPIDQFFAGVGEPVVANEVTPSPLPIVPGLFTSSRIASEGVFAELDRRDNSDGLTRGLYVSGRVGNYDGTGDASFHDFGWVGGAVDARGYIPLFQNRTSVALRFASELDSPKGGSQIPFYDQARLGGISTLRGFDTFRYYGEKSVLFQAELRETVWRRSEDSGLDVFGFGDTGQVWGVNSNAGFDGARFNDLKRENFAADGGGGFQYRVSKSLAARVEVGRSNERTRVWVSVSRGF